MVCQTRCPSWVKQLTLSVDDSCHIQPPAVGKSSSSPPYASAPNRPNTTPSLRAPSKHSTCASYFVTSASDRLSRPCSHTFRTHSASASVHNLIITVPLHLFCLLVFDLFIRGGVIQICRISRPIDTDMPNFQANLFWNSEI